MYLKQLEIHGFKSFAERIELNFADEINAVVGPNGSGKSNISDAIRWVLGEQSAKTLRGTKMEDIIFAGSEKKKALGFAEVSLCIDNSDKKIPVDFTEINVMRRIYRSGESEYYINKTHCRLKDIYELFMDTGIGRDGYSIIGQGRIDEILSNKSEDRRLVFEEAAGIVKYKTRKQEAERKLEHTKQNIVRVRDIIEEIEGQLEPMREQAEIAKRYRTIAEELKLFEVNLFIGNIEKFKIRLDGIKKEEEGIQELINNKMEYSTKLEAKHSQLKNLLLSIEKNLDELNEEIHCKANLKEKQEGECNLHQERIRNINENINNLNIRKLEINEEFKKSGQSIESNKKKLVELNNVYEDINYTIREKLKDYQNKYKSMEIIENDMESKQQLLIKHINSNSEIKSKINSAISFIENINRRIKQIETDTDIVRKQQEEKQISCIATKSELEDYENSLLEYNRKIISLKQDKQNYEISIKALEGKISTVRTSKDSTSSRLKVLEEMQKDYGGYSKSVKNILNESTKIVKSFCGAIGELISVPSQYVTAIEIALGGSVQSIVTETENDAKLLIEHLKKHNLGRATFLPISSVKPRFFNDKDKRNFGIEGFVGVAAELIKYDSKINNIIGSLLGRTAIVNNMDSAIKLARLAGYEYKIVTLTGEVLNAGGSITGGSINQATSSVLSRKSEIENLKVQVEQFKNDYEELSSRINEFRNQLIDNEKSINQKISESHNLQIELNNCKNKHANLLSDIQLIDDRISLNRKEIEELSNEGTESNKSIEQYKEKSESMENERIALESQISELQIQAKQLKETKDAYNNEITDMKVKMAAIEQNKNSLEVSIDELNKKVLKLQDDIISNEVQVEQLTSQAEQYSTELEQKKKEIIVIKHQIENLSKLYDSTGVERDKLHVETQEIQDNIKIYNKDTTELQNNLHKIEMQNAKLEVELENVEMKLLETYDMNYSNALSYKDENISISLASKRCDELKSEIRAMGSVNVNAVEEYEKLSQRYEFLNIQVDDLTKGRDSLIQVIVEISETMKNQFLTEFYKINENFTEVFAQLFGGGTAQLILSDESNVLESGIEIIAKPPGKKLQNLMLLSGGERALTATALLFAILKMKPAPFCVLDEIDAALDDANVDRYAKFLKEFSKTTQFIIVTHRKGTMQVADCLYGVSMEESGVSKLISVKLEDKVS